MKFLFFSLAKHQTLYFSKLLAQPGMQGRVTELKQLPFPALGKLFEVLKRVEWARLVAEKCQERQVKGKYYGTAYRLLLRAEMLVMALRCAALLARERPDALVVWNGSSRHCQLMLSLLEPGTQKFFFENGLLPGTTTLDCKGVNYLNSVPRTADFYRGYAQRVSNLEVDETVRLVPRKPRNEGVAAVVLPQRFIFIPFQDDRDTQIRFFSPWIRNMRALFELGERIAQTSDWTVVFKEHPSSRESYPDLHARCNARLFFANGNPTQQLIESSAVVISINSTVGLESLLLGKPLLTLGQAFFNVQGVVVHCESAQAVETALAAYPLLPVDAGLRRAFLHYLKYEYCIPGRWQDAEPAHLAEVVSRLRGTDNQSA
jgi:capsular polysaccharide export protein